MKVILDQQKRPQGVFLPLSDWETLKYGVNQASDLYKLMDELSHPDVFDMDAAQFSEYMEPIAAEAVTKALDRGLYVSYPAGADMPDAFIHEYKDGSKILVEIDKQTGKEHSTRKI